MKTITLITLFVGALAFITNAYASVSANMSVTSDYLWRGSSASNGDAAVQGGLDYDGGNYYAGIWVSTLGQAANSGLDGEEVDLYVGTNFNGLDLGVIKYEVSSTEVTEIYAGYSINGFDLYYAQDEETSDNDFFSVGYGFDVSESISGYISYGSWSDEAVAAELGPDDYIQVDLSYGPMTLTVLDADGSEDLDLAVSYSLPL
jgi:uncharacterized protein (TIGR02001 family)